MQKCRLQLAINFNEFVSSCVLPHSLFTNKANGKLNSHKCYYFISRCECSHHSNGFEYSRERIILVQVIHFNSLYSKSKSTHSTCNLESKSDRHENNSNEIPYSVFRQDQLVTNEKKKLNGFHQSSEFFPP